MFQHLLLLQTCKSLGLYLSLHSLLLYEKLLSLGLLGLMVQLDSLIPLLQALAILLFFRQDFLRRVKLFVCSQTKYFGSRSLTLVSGEFLGQYVQHKVETVPLRFSRLYLELLQELMQQCQLVILESLLYVCNSEGVLECFVEVVGFVVWFVQH